MAQNATMAEFEALLNESFKIDTPQEGSVVKGKVIAIEAGFAIVDVGYKMEGRVELKEFANPGEAPEVAVGDEVEVFLRQVENAKGEAVISREMARREEAWDRLEKAYADDARVDGAIFGRVKGGFTVDLGGTVAFRPGSQVQIRRQAHSRLQRHRPLPHRQRLVLQFQGGGEIKALGVLAQLPLLFLGG